MGWLGLVQWGGTLGLFLLLMACGSVEIVREPTRMHSTVSPEPEEASMVARPVSTMPTAVLTVDLGVGEVGVGTAGASP